MGDSKTSRPAGSFTCGYLSYGDGASGRMSSFTHTYKDSDIKASEAESKFGLGYLDGNIESSGGLAKFGDNHKGSDSKASGGAGNFSCGYLAYRDKASEAESRFGLCYFGVNLQGKRRQLLRRQYQRLCPCIPGGRHRFGLSSMGLGNQLEILTVACHYERPFVIRFRIWNDTN